MGPMTDFYFPCKRCGRQAGPSIRGLCGQCWPEGHASHEAWLAFVTDFERETGASPLADFEAFERWAEERVCERAL